MARRTSHFTLLLFTLLHFHCTPIPQLPLHQTITATQYYSLWNPTFTPTTSQSYFTSFSLPLQVFLKFIGSLISFLWEANEAFHSHRTTFPLHHTPTAPLLTFTRTFTLPLPLHLNSTASDINFQLTTYMIFTLLPLTKTFLSKGNDTLK